MRSCTKPLMGLLCAIILSGCGGKSASTAHPNGGPDLSKVTSAEGLVYSVDDHELLLQGTNSPLRFKLSEATAQQVDKGKHLRDLQRGDRIRVDIQYAGQGMSLKSFEILSLAADSKKSDPHAGLNMKGVPGQHSLNTYSPQGKNPQDLPTPQGLQSPNKSDKGENQNEKAINGLVLLGALTGVLAMGVPAQADVKEVYTKNCKKCHGEDGKGQTAQGKKEHAADWTSAEFKAKKMSDADIKDAILNGRKKDGKVTMKPMKDKVSDAEATELVKMVKEFK